MTQQTSSFARWQADALSAARIQRLLDELRYAIQHTNRDTMTRWALQSVKIFGMAVKRRAVNVYTFAKRMITVLAREAKEGYVAAGQGQLAEHAQKKLQDLSAALKRTGEGVAQNVQAIAQRIMANPRDAAPELAAAVLGLLAGSGGFDANGGIPDKDIAVGGIGSHRSAFTHSVLTGTVLETAVFSLALLVNAVYQNLPEEHDPFWDRMVAEMNRMSVAFVAGACAGLAYHLLADATWQAGKPYADLPFTMPMEGHQVLMGGSALAEALRAGEFANQQGRKSLSSHS
ncbi:MAG: hypothetical protein K6U75_12490 [Firmicutes bacterium]|nr:hypothetical protein [Bacillota bacterium]